MFKLVVKLLRDPVSIFFVLGAALFVAYAALNAPQEDPITLSAAGKAVLLAEFESLRGRPASPKERDQLVLQFYQRELLFREAIASELYRSDAGIREALIEAMQQQVTGEMPEPSGADLVNYYADNIQRYYSEASLSVEQRFFLQRPDDPKAVLATLNAGVEVAGDSAWQGRTFPNYGESMLRGLFGQSQLSALQALPIGVWAGPFEAVDGWRFFRVTDRRDGALLAFADVQGQVRADHQAALLAARVAAFVETQRGRYPLRELP